MFSNFSKTGSILFLLIVGNTRGYPKLSRPTSSDEPEFGIDSSLENFSHFDNNTVIEPAEIHRSKRVAPIIVALASLAVSSASLANSIKNDLGGRVAITVANLASWNFHIACSSADDIGNFINLDPKQVLAFGFTPNFWGTTHFWCTVKSDGIDRTFPAYNEGAPKNSNSFELRWDGIYLDGRFFRGY